MLYLLEFNAFLMLGAPFFILRARMLCNHQVLITDTLRAGSGALWVGIYSCKPHQASMHNLVFRGYRVGFAPPLYIYVYAIWAPQHIYISCCLLARGTLGYLDLRRVGDKIPKHCKGCGIHKQRAEKINIYMFERPKP